MASDLIRDEDYRSASQTLKQVADGVLPKHSAEAKAALRVVDRYAKQCAELLGLNPGALTESARSALTALYQMKTGLPVLVTDSRVVSYHNATQAIEGYRAARPVSLKDGRQIMRECGSYERLPRFFEIAENMTRRNAMRLLGEFWSICDNVSKWRADLEMLLPQATEPQMMDATERAILTALPEIVTVYRGADRGVNEYGVCWSLDRSVAERFPFLMRYRAARPVLVTGKVPKSLIIALKVGREESEIISTAVDVITVVDLLEPAVVVAK